MLPMAETLVYGRSPYGYLTIVPRADADTAADRIRAVLAATTVGEARRHDAPGVEDDDADEAPFDIRETGLVDDGDWPPNAGMLALETLPSDVRDLLAGERSMVGQEWVEIPDAQEEQVVTAIRALGYTVERDDAYIEAFDELGSL